MSARRATANGAGFVAVALVAAPVLLGGIYSLLAALGVAGAGAATISASRIVRVLSDAETWRSLTWTLLTAATATSLATAAAVVVSVRLQESRAGRVLAMLPLAVPHVAAALAALLLLGQSGLLSRLAFAAGWVSEPAAFPVLVYDRTGISLIFAFAWKEFPFLALTGLVVLQTAGQSLHEVAQTLGADARAIFRRVTWPLLWRGMTPAVLAVFAYLIGQYEMAVLLAPSDPLPFPLLTYERISDPALNRRGEAHVLGLIALLLTIALVLLHERVRETLGGWMGGGAHDRAADDRGERYDA